ncbi:DUF808 domain-containing protein [Caulobacter sp. D4A]|uniref:DUF808 domain-containing protein n=1 Tax=Caulobacter sp. D4A TaxID=2204171 RepID=UPI000D730C49|nr:DUF808 domain-containing protein [Caulobacter sp. D4A]PXA85200.1 DUF808 domain-containing protein [Caulobacter sp. D4A]
MSVGLIALLDDVAALAKAAAASLDDVVAQAGRAGAKAAGVVIDDAAVTPRYVTGFSPARELPIIARIAFGSLKNKLLFLLPAALILSLLVPQAITPLLMLGGLYLCYEGAEKVYELIMPHAAHVHEAELAPADLDAKTFEDQKVAGAVRTDFILSAEIMAITLGSLPAAGLAMQALVLAVVGIMITAGVYGLVALIVKADDLGLWLANRSSPGGALLRMIGRALVQAMPYLLNALGVVGTAAMIWVGGGIIIHGAEEFGFGWLGHLIHEAGEGAARSVPAFGGVISWLVQAAASGLVGILIGLATIPAVSHGVAPAWHWCAKRLRKMRTA